VTVFCPGMAAICVGYLDAVSVLSVMAVIVAVFFGHEMNFLHQVKDFTSELVSHYQDFDRSLSAGSSN